MSFTTREEVAKLANRAMDDLTDAQLEQLDSVILFVDGIIENYCGHPIVAADYESVRYDGTGTAYLDLGVYPINSIKMAKVRATDGTFTDVTAEVEVLPDGVIGFIPTATTLTKFTAGTYNWFVTFNAGLTTIPNDLGFVATSIGSRIFSRVVDENIDMEKEGYDQTTHEYASIDMNKTELRVLDRHRKVSIY